jgi:hypothetical protein
VGRELHERHTASQHDVDLRLAIVEVTQRLQARHSTPGDHDGHSDEFQKWVQMSAGEKAAFIGKLCIFIVSFGFAFPTLLND